MKTSKILSLSLAIALMFCLSSSIFATTTSTPSSTTADTSLNSSKLTDTITVGSTLHLPKIEVTVRAPQEIIVNPYKMPYEAGKFDTLIAAPTVIESTSTIPMKVSATPQGEKVTDSRVEFTTDPDVEDNATLTKPTVYVKMEMKNFTSATEPTSSWTSGTNLSDVVVTETNTTPASITLAAIGSGTPASTVTYGAYKFTGESGGPGWGEKDLIKVNVIFSIDPVISSTP